MPVTEMEIWQEQIWEKLSQLDVSSRYVRDIQMGMSNTQLDMQV